MDAVGPCRRNEQACAVLEQLGQSGLLQQGGDAEARRRWPELRRLVMLHRTGPVPVGESAVVVVASSPHRDDAFEAGRFCIDQLKATVPIWKREVWAEGESWGLEAQHITEVGS